VRRKARLASAGVNVPGNDIKTARKRDARVHLLQQLLHAAHGLPALVEDQDKGCRPAGTHKASDASAQPLHDCRWDHRVGALDLCVTILDEVLPYALGLPQTSCTRSTLLVLHCLQVALPRDVQGRAEGQPVGRVVQAYQCLAFAPDSDGGARSRRFRTPLLLRLQPGEEHDHHHLKGAARDRARTVKHRHCSRRARVL